MKFYVCPTNRNAHFQCSKKEKLVIICRHMNTQKEVTVNKPTKNIMSFFYPMQFKETGIYSFPSILNCLLIINAGVLYSVCLLNSKWVFYQCTFLGKNLNERMSLKGDPHILREISSMCIVFSSPFSFLNVTFQTNHFEMHSLVAYFIWLHITL